MVIICSWNLGTAGEETDIELLGSATGVGNFTAIDTSWYVCAMTSIGGVDPYTNTTIMTRILHGKAATKNSLTVNFFWS